MSDVLHKLRRARPSLTEDLLGICALAVIFFGAAQLTGILLPT